MVPGAPDGISRAPSGKRSLYAVISSRVTEESPRPLFGLMALLGRSCIKGLDLTCTARPNPAQSCALRQMLNAHG